ncbi:ABC transporter permease subunit [Clostridium sp. MCC353]|uniref:ABC transporter permease n=1 Tax=Clostridium sp. MCC353 TaxID=2592646 RepID=UPI0020797D31|nr:ABC transporter permease subunit [Clostridium sp. MCC353]
MIIYRYVPMLGLSIAFKNFSFSKGIWDSEWVGLKNFEFLFFRHPNFFQLVYNTLIINIYKLLFYFPIPIILAIFLNELKNLKLKKWIQTTIYLPHFVSWVVFGSIVIQFLMPSTGIVNAGIKLLGMDPVFFLAEPKYFRAIVVITEIIKSAGWGTILYLAALVSINPELYEAAAMDGASRWQKMRFISIPGISGTIVVLLLLEIGKMMDVGFEQIYVLANSQVYSVGDVLSTYIYRIGIGQAQFSITTAIGLFQSAIGLVLIVSANSVCKRLFDKNLW